MQLTEYVRENNLPVDTPITVVTDDPKWVKLHLKGIDPYARLNSESSKYSDFQCMYFAKYLIISNSTFSLWAAFLGEHDQVIAPSYWWPSQGLPSQLVQINRQPICYPSWCFNDPLTGKIVTESYHWGAEYWSTNCWLNRTLRAIFAMNIFRKKIK